MSGRILVLGLGAFAPDLARVFLDFKVGVENTFEEALDALGRQAVDAVLLGLDFDYSRPFRIVRRVREHEQHTPIPVVLVDPDGRTTKYPDAERRYRELGADHFFNLHSAIQLDGRDRALTQLRNQVLWRISTGSGIQRPTADCFLDASSVQCEPAYLGSALLRVGLSGLFARCRRCRSEHFAPAEPSDPITYPSALICSVCEAVTTLGELVVQIGGEALAAARQRLDTAGC